MDPITSSWLLQPDGLAARLRAMRAQAGLSGKKLAETTGWPASKISRIEHGKQMPTAPDIESWARACAADRDVTHELLELLGDAHAFQLTWKQRAEHGQTPIQHTYNGLVQDAQQIRSFQTTAMPGMLQTADYARHILSGVNELPGMKVNDVDDAVATRMQRQQNLYDPNRRFEFILTEPVLRWLPGPLEVMITQLDRLQTIPDLANVQLGIIPLDVELTTVPQHSFLIRDDDIVVIEHFLGETIYKGKAVQTFATIMDRLWAEARTGDDARQLILNAANTHRQRASSS